MVNRLLFVALTRPVTSVNVSKGQEVVVILCLEHQETDLSGALLVLFLCSLLLARVFESRLNKRGKAACIAEMNTDALGVAVLQRGKHHLWASHQPLDALSLHLVLLLDDGWVT